MTQPPLTDTDRASLDNLVRRAAGWLTLAEQSRLLRLWEQHRSDYEQARRTNGGLNTKKSELTKKLIGAEARIAAVRALCADAANPCRHHAHLCPADVRAALDSLTDRPSDPS